MPKELSKEERFAELVHMTIAKILSHLAVSRTSLDFKTILMKTPLIFLTLLRVPEDALPEVMDGLFSSIFELEKQYVDFIPKILEELEKKPFNVKEKKQLELSIKDPSFSSLLSSFDEKIQTKYLFWKVRCLENK